MTFTLYDLVGANDARFSPPCWWAKLAFDLKKVAYTTKPVTFSQIKTIGEGEFRTVPVAHNGNLWIKDSWDIIEYLEQTSLHAPMFVDRDRYAHAFYARQHVIALLGMCAPLIFVQICEHHLPEEERAYFRTSREKRVGRTLEEAALERAHQLPMIHKAMRSFDEVLAKFHFLDGDHPGYADAHLLGLLVWVRTVSDLPITEQCQHFQPWLKRCRDVFPSLPPGLEV